MDRQLRQLIKLVDELLDLSRITQGKIRIDHQRIDPRGLFDAAVEAVRSEVDDAGHELTVSLDVPPSLRLFGDADRLIQVLVNLLSNAIKYTPARGHVELAGRVADGGTTLVIVVRDDGIGIAPDMLADIFEIFVQCRDALGRARGGLGIGLNLVRRIVEIHGGTVRAASAGAGRGSEFTVELPLVAEGG
jgi:signal transduction histidine kinase